MVCKMNYAVLIAVILTIIGGISMAIYLSSKNSIKQVDSSVSTAELPVIMYHHILKSTQNDYVVSPVQLEADLKYLSDKGYTTVTSTQIVDFVENGVPLPEKSVYITFDDSFESIYTYAMPLFEKYNMNAAILVLGKHTDLFSDPNEPKSLDYSHLSWTQLREMQQSGIFEIGNHTYDMHGNEGEGRYGITKNKNETQEEYISALTKDIGGLSTQIYNEIGVEPVTFAYPFGANSKGSRDILTDLDFKIILTCEEKVNKIETGTKVPISLKRFNRASKYSTYDFFKRLGIE